MLRTRKQGIIGCTQDSNNEQEGAVNVAVQIYSICQLALSLAILEVKKHGCYKRK